MCAYETNNNRPERTLYHCVNQEIVGTELRTSYLINQRRYLFATNYLSKAAVFVFDYHKDEILSNGPIPQSLGEWCIIYELGDRLRRPFTGSILAFDGIGFRAVPQASRQWISDQPVPLSRCKIVKTISAIEEIMALNVQIFKLPTSSAQTDTHYVISTIEQLGLKNGLATLCKKVGMKWLNDELSTQPDRYFGY
jgi:hypothetical protein